MGNADKNQLWVRSIYPSEKLVIDVQVEVHEGILSSISHPGVSMTQRFSLIKCNNNVTTVFPSCKFSVEAILIYIFSSIYVATM